MQLIDIYQKPIRRQVNPAVSATKLDDETKNIEIEEYVFTDEILNGIYRILNAIRNNAPYDHVGMWINGYYGSGKSHFLKYFDYCISPSTRDHAMSRLIEAVECIDPLDDKNNIEFTKEDLQAIHSWLKRAEIDTRIFNLETSKDYSSDNKVVFLHVFWNEFNKLRGFNEFNITLAQHLEKPLQEKGVFDQFKQRIADEGGDWNTDAADLVDNELQWVLDIAKDLAPTLDLESIRLRILNRDTNMSIKNFARELNSWLKNKSDDYRLVLLADEVSQFINKDPDRYLNLQEIVTHLSEACGNKVWIACTAQQDQSEVIEECKLTEATDSTGKILGRFEVQVSLKGTQPEYITQKRILDKKESAKKPLTQLYKKEENGFSQRFALPASYKGFTSAEEFVDFYPFVPYQFKLIMQVFNNFLHLGYVAKEVKGNERSIIKVVHATAKRNAEEEVGKLISFDQLYDNMFETGLQARGQNAIKNADKMAEEYPGDAAAKRFAKRVVNVLFMICNIAESDKLIFPATLQNITILLLNDFTTPFLTLKEDVKKVIEFLCEKNVIREEKARKGLDPFYSFYSEEEMKVAELIKNQIVDTTYQADQLRDIIQKYLTTLRNKEQYKTRSFSVGASVMQRTFLSNSPDVTVEFNMDAGVEVSDMLLRNASNRLLFLLGKDFHADNRLRNDFAWYCKVQKYAETPVANEDNAKVRDEFGKRALETLQTQIIPKVRAILDNSPVLSGSSEVDSMLLSGKKGPERYSEAMKYHLGMIYTQAGMVDATSIPRDTASLRTAINRPVQPGEYEGLGAALTPAEQEVERFLMKQGGMDVNLTQVTAKFAQPPYGWLELCTMYVVNELVRRHRRDFSYANNRNVDASTIAAKIVTETNKFAVREGEAIPQELVNRFIDSWMKVFGISQSFGSTDSTQIYRTAQERIEKYISEYDKLISTYRKYNFINPLNDFVELMRKWQPIRDISKFFNVAIEDADKAAQLMDSCKEVLEFVHDQIGKFDEIVRFADENRDNFTFLSDEQRDLASDLQDLGTQPWPFRIRDYIKKKKEVEGALNDVRDRIREDIKAEYIRTYDLLCRSAEQEGVEIDIVAEPQAIFGTKCLPGNILVLRNNLNTDDYFSREAAKIQQEKLRKQTPPPTNTGGNTGKAEPKPYKTSCNLTLDTRVVGLDNEAAVDAYLARLKKKIMEKINDNKIVTIIK